MKTHILSQSAPPPRVHRSIVGLLIAMMAWSIVPRSTLAVSSWNPTLIVNTESFQQIDAGDSTTTVDLRFGSSTSVLTLLTTGKFQFNKSLSVVGGLSGSYLTIDGQANFSGAVVGKSHLTAKGTLSGSRLVVSGHGNISGSLIIKNNLSGASLFSFGLGDCNNDTTSKLIYNPSTGKFRCATDQTGGSSGGLGFSTAENIYVNQKGDTMTGNLIIQSTSGTTVPNLLVRGGMSGYFLRTSGSADIHGPIALSGALRGDGDFTINDDRTTGADAVLTFGNQTANQTIKFLHAGQKFEFSKSINVIGTISGSLLTQNGAGDNYFLGDLGIGTTAPGAELDVKKAEAGGIVAGRIWNADATNTASHARLQLATDPAGGDPFLYFSTVGAQSWAAGIDNSDGDKFKFSQSADVGISTVMTIDTTSNVGINTTSPDTKLAVIGTISGSALRVDGNADVNGTLSLSGATLRRTISDPSAPGSSRLATYAFDLGGRSLLRSKAAVGNAYAYQPGLFQSFVMMLVTGGGTTINGIGTTVTNDTTVSHPAVDEVFGYMANFATSTTNNDTAGTSSANTTFIRGSVAGANGFFYRARVGVVDTTSIRVFSGLANQTIATMVGADNPTGHHVGFQFSTNRGDTNWMITTKDGTTQTTASTGIAFTASKVYELTFYCSQQCTSMTWRVDNVTDGTNATGTASSNLPGTTTAMRIVQGVSTLTTAAKNFRMQFAYTETDR